MQVYEKDCEKLRVIVRNGRNSLPQEINGQMDPNTQHPSNIMGYNRTSADILSPLGQLVYLIDLIRD